MRDRLPFKGRESREAQAAAQKRAAQAERISRAKESIKEVFSKKRQGGEDVTDQVYGGGAPAEEDAKGKK